MRVRTEATVQHDSQATEYERKQVRVVQLISAYRQRGHQKANLDPLGLAEREQVPDLELGFHQLSTADFDTVFQTGSLHIGKADATLGEIYKRMSAPTAIPSAPSSCISSIPTSATGSCSAWSRCAPPRISARKCACSC